MRKAKLVVLILKIEVEINMHNSILIEKTGKQININKLCEQIAPNRDDIIFIAGSLVERQTARYSDGMGNIYSDIDVFIITRNIQYYQEVVYKGKVCKTNFFSIDGNSFDVEIYEYNEVMQFYQLLKALDFNEKDTDDIRIRNLFNLKIEDINKYMSFTHRFLNSIPIYNCDKYQDIKREICEINYYIYNKRLYINIIDLYYEDVVGYLEEQQGILAVYMARNLMVYAIGAYLFANKISFDREKWIPLLLENFSKVDGNAQKIFKDFKELFFCKRLNNNDDYVKNARKILTWINNLVDNL